MIEKHHQRIFEQKSFSKNRNIYLCIFSCVLLWSGNSLSNILSFLSTLCLRQLFRYSNLSFFLNIYPKNDLNKWNLFWVRLYHNWLIRPPHKVMYNTASILYYKRNQKSIYETIKINIWNISADIIIGNYDKCVFPPSKMVDTGWNHNFII